MVKYGKFYLSSACDGSLSDQFYYLHDAQYFYRKDTDLAIDTEKQNTWELANLLVLVKYGKFKQIMFAHNGPRHQAFQWSV